MTTPLALELLPAEACLPEADPLGPGTLSGQKDGRECPFPLRAMEVEAHLSGPLAAVDVRQTFANPFSDPIEAVYIFPLPHGAAVHRFRMKVGERVVDGEVKERQAARQEYEEGLRQGHRAALMEQERDNVFTVQLGNLPPGEEIGIELAYAGRMDVSEAETTFRFPLVVAPRYMPGDVLDGVPVGHGTDPDTDRVPDASRLTPPRLHPGLHTGARLGLRVVLDTAGLLPQRMACSQHATSQRAEDGRLVVELARGDELLNRDFLLRFRLAAEEARPVLLVDDRHFLLSLAPPRELRERAGGRDVLVLLDHSGSMAGSKMESAKRAVARFLELLEAGDRFALVAFDDKVEPYRKGAMHGLEQVPDALRWLQRISADGGTEIYRPLQEALGRQAGPNQVLCVVLITDGEVGNEPEIYRMVQERSQNARLFTLGIDTAVNDAFLRRVAQVGRGTCELVAPGEGLEEALQRMARETGRPLLVDLELVDEGLGLEPGSLAPSRVPDLFAARPSVTLGLQRGAGGAFVKGRRPDGTPWSEHVPPTRTDSPALGLVWARERVTALEDRLRLGEGDRAQVEAEILKLALDYRILTRFTAFVLVDRAEVVNAQGHARTVVQPVESPAEWDMCLDAAAGGGGMAFGAPMQMESLACESAPAMPLMRRAKEAAQDAFAGLSFLRSKPMLPGPGGPPTPPPAKPSLGGAPKKRKQEAEPPAEAFEERREADDVASPCAEAAAEPYQPTAEELVERLRQALPTLHSSSRADAVLRQLLERLRKRASDGPPFPDLVKEGEEFAAELATGGGEAARLEAWLDRVERALKDATDHRDRWWAGNV